MSAAPDDAETAIRFRGGFMLGDGIGSGMGRVGLRLQTALPDDRVVYVSANVHTLAYVKLVGPEGVNLPKARSQPNRSFDRQNA